MENEKIKSLIEKHEGKIKREDQRRIYASVGKDCYLELFDELKKNGLNHLTAITGTDIGEKFEILYHLETGNGTLLNISFEVEKENESIESITNIFPGAILYEREIMDMLGLEVKGHPDPRRLFLADSWPEHKHPLRKGKYNYSEIVKQNISEIKNFCRELEDIDYKTLLEKEKNEKNRSSLKKWLKNQMKKEGDKNDV
ncbi:MAG: NADH-quinone oxidoreductase subunit C [Candidatus Hadarchaeia archaeon]